MFQTIQTFLPDLIQAALMLVGFLSILAAFTPTPTDNTVLAVLKKLLDFAAMNWGHAANAEKAAKYDAATVDRTARADRAERP